MCHNVSTHSYAQIQVNIGIKNYSINELGQAQLELVVVEVIS